jgi:ABC-type nitrate/sulfonate/bicarbonate transport system substrate-binding protein
MHTDTLWYTTCPGPSALSIAGALGWLADELAPDGITPRTLASAAGPPALIRDGHQLASPPETFPWLLRHGGNPPPLVALARGKDLRIVGLTWTEGIRRVLALDGSGITEPADLAGKRLALPHRDSWAVDYPRSVVLRTYGEALISAGLTAADVEFVELAGGTWSAGEDGPAARGDIPFTQGIGSARSTASMHLAEAQALLRGEVDVIVAEHAQAAALQASLRLRTVFDTARLASATQRANGDQPLVLTASGRVLAERPDVVVRVIARALDAADWAASRRQDTVRLAALDAGLPEELVPEAFSPEVHEQLAITLEARSVHALRRQYDHLLEHGFLSAPFDLDAAIDPEPLAAARELRASQIAAVAS